MKVQGGFNSLEVKASSGCAWCFFPICFSLCSLSYLFGHSVRGSFFEITPIPCALNQLEKTSIFLCSRLHDNAIMRFRSAESICATFRCYLVYSFGSSNVCLPPSALLSAGCYWHFMLKHRSLLWLHMWQRKCFIQLSYLIKIHEATNYLNMFLFISENLSRVAAHTISVLNSMLGWLLFWSHHSRANLRSSDQPKAREPPESTFAHAKAYHWCISIDVVRVRTRNMR